MPTLVRRDRIVLVTSGIGPSLGGIGVASGLLVQAIGSARLALWRHPHRWPSLARRAALGLQAVAGSLATGGLIIYEHVDLAGIHAAIPWLARRPYAVFLHGVEVWRRLDGRRKRTLQSASVRLANSGFTVREARRLNPWLGDVRVTHLGVAPPRYPITDAKARDPQALLIGRMSVRERYKGHDQVLDAWPAIREAVPSARLVIAGGGDDAARVRGRARGMPGVDFVGRVDDRTRDALYAASRVVLFLSRQEGFGFVGIEAAVRGAAVVGLRGTVIEELFPEGGPILAEGQEPAAIVAASVPLLADGERAQRAASIARARAEALFLEHHAVERMRGALREWL